LLNLAKLIASLLEHFMEKVSNGLNCSTFRGKLS